MGDTVAVPSEIRALKQVVVQMCVAELFSLLRSLFSAFPGYRYHLGAWYTWLPRIHPQSSGIRVSREGLGRQVFRATWGSWQTWEAWFAMGVAGKQPGGKS